METSLKFYRVHENVQLPKFATEQSACFDVAYNNAGKHEYTGYNKFNSPITRGFVSEKLHVAPGERMLVPTGLILDIPVGYSVRLHPRSGLSFRKGIVLANHEAVIDSDYTQELFLLIHNTTEIGFDIFNNDRLAQGELIKSETYTLEETKEAPKVKTDRVGGLGSTGLNQDVFLQAEKKKGRIYTKETINPPTKTRPLKKKIVEKSEIVAENILDKVDQT